MNRTNRAIIASSAIAQLAAVLGIGATIYSWVIGDMSLIPCVLVTFTFVLLIGTSIALTEAIRTECRRKNIEFRLFK